MVRSPAEKARKPERGASLPVGTFILSNIAHLPQRAAVRALTTKEAGRYLGISHRTLEHWRLVGGGPRFMKFGRSVRYPASELEAFMDRPVFANTSEARAA